MALSQYFQTRAIPVARALAPARRSRRHTTECGLPDTPRWLYRDGCAVQREQARSPQGISINRRAFSWQVAAHDAGPARSESVYPALTQCSQAAPIPVARELAPARWRSRRHTAECGLPDTPRWLYWDGCAVQREQARSPQGIFINRRAFSWPVAAHDAGPARSESVYPALTQCSQAAPIPVARELAPARWRSHRHKPECGLPDTPR